MGDQRRDVGFKGSHESKPTRISGSLLLTLGPQLGAEDHLESGLFIRGFDYNNYNNETISHNSQCLYYVSYMPEFPTS